MIRTPAMDRLFEKLKRVLSTALFNQICSSSVTCEYQFEGDFKDGVLITYANSPTGTQAEVSAESEWFYSDILWFRRDESYLKDSRHQLAFEAFISTMKEYRDPIVINRYKPLLKIQFKGDTYSVVSSTSAAEQLSLI